MESAWNVAKKTRGLLGLLALGLLLGACNLQGGGSGGNACQHPLFGPETPKWVCADPQAWVDGIYAQAEDLPSPPPDMGPSWLLGEIQMIPSDVQYRAGSHGPALGYLKVPGFPEHRFLVTRRVPLVVDEQCFGPPLQDCFERALREYSYAVGTSGQMREIGGGAVNTLFPLVTGKDGQVGGEWEWLVQMRTTRMYGLVRDPVHYAQVLQQDPDPTNGKTYAFKTRYRIELRPGKYPKVLPEGVMRDTRRAPEYDPYPMVQGYSRSARQMANKYRFPDWAQEGYTPWPELEAIQHHWDNESYYAFQVGSGVISPPTPICQPGLGWVMPFVQGPFVPRKVPLDPSRVPERIWRSGDLLERIGAIEPYVRYIIQRVYLVDRDVVDYTIAESGQTGGWGTHQGYLGTFAASDSPRYPVQGLGDPPGRTFRAAILYRFTAIEGWEPHPSHPYGEDEWHIVWSRVHLGGTRDNPDCRTLEVGFHTYDRATSARLDGYFGLGYVPRGFEIFYPFFSKGPLLTRLSDYPFEGPNLRLVQPGQIQLPDWALPPGW